MNNVELGQETLDLLAETEATRQRLLECIGRLAAARSARVQPLPGGRVRLELVVKPEEADLITGALERIFCDRERRNPGATGASAETS